MRKALFVGGHNGWLVCGEITGFFTRVVVFNNRSGIKVPVLLKLYACRSQLFELKELAHNSWVCVFIRFIHTPNINNYEFNLT